MIASELSLEHLFQPVEVATLTHDIGGSEEVTYVGNLMAIRHKPDSVRVWLGLGYSTQVLTIDLDPNSEVATTPESTRHPIHFGQ